MLLLSITIVGLLLAGSVMAGEKVYGEGVSSSDTMLVSVLLADPDAYVGKVVRVEGTAVGVCAHRGCWVNIASDKEGDVVRVKVEDGVIVFPPEIIGDHVVAEGVWTSNQLDLETTKKVCAHRAQEEGEEFDPESVTSCMTLYQITGTGAVVKEVAQTEKLTPVKETDKDPSQKLQKEQTNEEG